jgi:transposase
VKKKEVVSRLWMTLPIGRRPTFIEWGIQRLRCMACGVVRQAKIPFADPDRRYTRGFERYVLELSRHMTIQDVAHHLGISWHTVKEIQKRELQRRFSAPSLKGLRRIAIDEISIGRGHRYLTVVLDLHSGAVVFVGEGKGANALEPFWKRLRSSKACTDLLHRIFVTHRNAVSLRARHKIVAPGICLFERRKFIGVPRRGPVVSWEE